MSLLKEIKVSENFTKLPEFKMDELNNILDTIVFDQILNSNTLKFIVFREDY